MDPADQAQLSHALQALQAQIQVLTQQNNQLQAEVLDTRRSFAEAQAQSSTVQPKVELPAKFDGSPSKLRGFVNQIRLIIEQQPRSYPESNQRARVFLVGNLLRDDAQAWWDPIFEDNDEILNNFEQFLARFQTRFRDPNLASNAASALRSMKQGKLSVAAHASKFERHLSDARWDQAAAMDAFRVSLNNDVRDLLLSFDDPQSLEVLITQANSAYNRLSQRQREKLHYGGSNLGSMPLPINRSSPAPMEIGTLDHQRRRLDPVERQRRIENNLCLYAGCSGHQASDCPIRTSQSRRPLSGNGSGCH